MGVWPMSPDHFILWRLTNWPFSATAPRGKGKRKTQEKRKSVCGWYSDASWQGTFVRFRNAACSGCTWPCTSQQRLASPAQAGFQSPLSPLPRVLFSEQPAQLWPAALTGGRQFPNAVADEGSQETEIRSKEVTPALGYGYRVWWV